MGLVLEPVLGLLSLLVDDLEWCLLVPVLGLLGLGVGDFGLINPGVWLAVLLVVNLLRRVEGWGEVLKKAALLYLLAVLSDGKGVVGVDNEGVELRGLGDLSGRWGVHVLLLVFAGLGVLVVDDEVNLVRVAALVGAKHDHVRRRVGELLLVKGLVVSEELQVGTSALKAV